MSVGLLVPTLCVLSVRGSMFARACMCTRRISMSPVSCAYLYVSCLRRSHLRFVQRLAKLFKQGKDFPPRQRFAFCLMLVSPHHDDCWGKTGLERGRYMLIQQMQSTHCTDAFLLLCAKHVAAVPSMSKALKVFLRHLLELFPPTRLVDARQRRH